MNQIDTGKFIASCRKEKGLTQAQLAEKLNINDRAVSKWETGKFMPESQFKDIGLTKKDFITLTNSMADMDFTSGLENVSCPVLVLCGEKDNVNKKAAIKIAEKLSRAKFSTIENSGHEVNIDNPNGLAKAMEELNIV